MCLYNSGSNSLPPPPLEASLLLQPKVGDKNKFWNIAGIFVEKTNDGYMDKELGRQKERDR